MTLKELSQLYYLNREIEMYKRRLEELKDKAESVTASLSGLPHGSGSGDKVGRYAAEIADLKGIINAKQIQCLFEQNRLERYIGDIGDSLTRQIFSLRFIDGLSWHQVAMHIGGGNTDESVKKRAYRYINSKRCPECPE